MFHGELLPELSAVPANMDAEAKTPPRHGRAPSGLSTSSYVPWGVMTWLAETRLYNSENGALLLVGIAAGASRWSLGDGKMIRKRI